MADLVVFACVHAAGRSRMAEALFTRLADPARAVAVSAGTDPAGRVQPEVEASLAEIGLRPKPGGGGLLTPGLAGRPALVVTMGCGESCPSAHGIETLDWPLDDPKGRSPDEVRRLRDEIALRVARLVRERGWSG